MSNGKPPFPMNFDPRALLGAPMGRPAQAPQPQVEARLIARDSVQMKLYNAAAVVAQAKASLIQALSMLSETHLACVQTVEHARSSDGLVQIGDHHVSATQFATRFQLARPAEEEAVAVAIARIREIVEDMPDEKLIELANREPAK